MGRKPKLTDAELLPLAEARRAFRGALAALCPRTPARRLPLPSRSIRLQQTPAQGPTLLKQAIRALATDTDLWHNSVWVTDSTPIECGRSRPSAQRSDLAGWAGYGYCRSHTRYFWGLRLPLICTPTGLPITWALATPNIDERQVLMAICEHDPHLLADRPGLLIIADKGYVSTELDTFLAERGARLFAPVPPQPRTPPRRTPPQAHPPAHRVRQRHAQGLARPRTARRQNRHRGRGSHRPAHPGPDRRHLAQPRHRPAHHPVTDRLRPPTRIRTYSSSTYQGRPGTASRSNPLPDTPGNGPMPPARSDLPTWHLPRTARYRQPFEPPA
ncbi:transposase [Nonomuraea sp. JJY05]|uniref:transposase n=1 Tax=Nonomuraea sp. JJY05 TaxID=3350255 RepID=UPI00373F31B5